jgi:hypothetical protein
MFKKMCIGVLVCVCAATVAHAAAPPGALGYDSFDTKVLGSQIQGQAPEVGTMGWVGVFGGENAPAQSIVVDDPLNPGNNVLQTTRTGESGAVDVGMGGGALTAGQYVVEMDYYGPSGLPTPSCGYSWLDNGLGAWNLGAWSDAWDIGIDYAAYDPSAGYVHTEISPSRDAWDHLEFVLDVVDIGDLIPGYLSGTYDLYITLGSGPNAGVRQLAMADIQMGAFEPGTVFVEVGSHWTDGVTYGDQVAYYDNVLITPEPATLVLLGMGLFGLVRRRGQR